MSDMFEIPKEKDFKALLQDADDQGLLEEEAGTLVNNPLSWLRFTSGFGPLMRYEEMKAKELGLPDPFKDKIKETEEQRDTAREIERAIVKGGTGAVKSILEFATAGIDLSGKTNLTKKLDETTRKFLNKHGNPNTFLGDSSALLIQYGVPSTIAFKILGNLGKVSKLKNISKFTDKTLGKIKNKYFRATADVALRSGS